MTPRGDIYSPWAGRAKEYSWALCLKLSPKKNITPMDIDFMVEYGQGHFLFFEMKTAGTEVPHGQAVALAHLVRKYNGRALVCVVEHVERPRVEIPTDVVRCQLWGFQGPYRPVHKAYYDGAEFEALYRAFFDWASGDKKAFKDIPTLP